MADLPTRVFPESRAKLGLGVLTMAPMYLLLMVQCGAFRHVPSLSLYLWIGGAGVLLAVFGALAVWRPTLTFTPTRFEARSIGGLSWVDWKDISEMALFRSPQGRWLWGLRFRPGAVFRWSGASMTRAYFNCDAAIGSQWEVGLDEVARTGAEYWKANGGSGEVKDFLHPRPVSVLTSSS